MRKIDELASEPPVRGSRMLRDLLRQQGIDVGRLHVKTLMKKMGIERSIAGRTPRNPRRDIGFTRIC